MRINPLAAVQSLGIALKGWVGVFIVIAIVYGLIAVLNAATNRRGKSEE